MSKSDQRHLRGLCRRALAFENHFSALYRTYLLQELHEDQHENQLRAVERLGQIQYSGQDIEAALAQLMGSADAKLRNAVIATKQQRDSTRI